MTFGGTSISSLAGVIGRTFGGNRVADTAADQDFDIYDRATNMRADIEALLSEEMGDISVAEEREQRLCESEKQEHDTMGLIRGALYPAD